jgi:hypothetical protein
VRKCYERSTYVLVFYRLPTVSLVCLSMERSHQLYATATQVHGSTRVVRAR